MQGEGSSSIATFLKRIEAAENPDQEILKLLLAKVEEKDPALAEAIRYCAIPRRFDSQIIGVLRQAPDDRETSERLLRDLTSYSFVRGQSDGSYSYDDATRNALLVDWTEKERDRFDQLNQLLVAFYQKQFERTSELEQDLISVSGVIQKANPSRYLQLASAAESKVVLPLLDALYHETQRSAEAGYKLFQSYYEKFENEKRLTMCESILRETRGCLENLPAGTGRGIWLKWLKYWKARHELNLGRPDEAGRRLQLLIKELEKTSKRVSATDDVIKLRLWVLGELGFARQQEWQVREAIEAFQSAIKLAKESDKDPFNLPLWHYRLAGLYFSLDELEPAAEEYHEAIKAARDRNPRLEIYSRLDLSGVLLSSGNRTEAFCAALEALHAARTKFPEDIPTHRFVDQQFMAFFSRENPALLDSLFTEGQALLRKSGDEQGQIQLHRQYVTMLRKSGQLVRAEQELSTLEANVSNDERLKAGILLERALLREEQGRLIEVMNTYDELAEKARASKLVWDYAAALSNRGMAHSKLAHWKEAEADLQDAIERWDHVGYCKLAALVRIPLATAFRKQGQISRADEVLKTVISILGDMKTGYLAEYHRECGDLFRDQALTENSREEYKRCLDICLALEEYEMAARVLGELASLASDQGAWGQAQEHTSEALRWWRRLAELNAFRKTETSAKADQLNANGMQLFSADGENRLGRVKDAAAQFDSACELEPENFWFQLNRAYARAELKDWPEAIEALEAALESCSADFQASVLYERLGEYRAFQAQQMVEAGNYAEAAQFYAESKKHLDGRITIDREAMLLLGLGDSLLRLSQLQKAEDEYSEGLKRLENTDFALLKAAFHARVGFMSVLHGDLSGAVSNFTLSVHLRRKMKSASAVSDLAKLGTEFSELIVNRQQYQTFLLALQTIINDPSLAAAESQDLLASKFHVIRNRFQPAQLPETAAAALRDVSLTPKVVIEADARLFPQDVETPQVKRMIDVDLPVMRRERIEKATGVGIPGIVIRANEALDNQYVLSLDEVPMVSGHVYPQMAFCLDIEKCREIGITGTLVTFLDGFKGVWLEDLEARKADTARLMLFDVYQYMTLHLEVQLRRHLATFVGVQEVSVMVNQWVENNAEVSGSWQTQVKADPNSLVRLAQIIRRLVEENVSIRNFDTVIKAFLAENAKTKDVTKLVTEIRVALKSEMAALIDGRRLVALTEQSEAIIAGWVRGLGPTRFLAIDWSEADQMIEVMSRELNKHGASGLALVVRDKDMRPFTRRLVITRFPDTPVVALDELPTEVVINESIELVSATRETNRIEM